MTYPFAIVDRHLAGRAAFSAAEDEIGGVAVRSPGSLAFGYCEHCECWGFVRVPADDAISKICGMLLVL